MPKPSSTWSFKKKARICNKDLENQNTLHQLISSFKSTNAEPNQPALAYAYSTSDTVSKFWYWNAIGLCEVNPVLAFRYFHLNFRSRALPCFVHLVRLRELYADWERQGLSGKRPPIQRIDQMVLADVTMLGAVAFSLREDDIGNWVFKECLRILTCPELYVENDTISGGSVAPFLLWIYGQLPGVSIDTRLRNGLSNADFGPFRSTIEAWDDPILLTECVRILADLHAYKSVNYLYSDEDGVYSLNGWNSEFPAELLFLQRVRRELGLSIPQPSHPMLESPLSNVPEEDFTSGYDQYLDIAIESVKKAGMPDLDIPWEKKFMAAGQNDPKRIFLEPPTT